LGFQQGTGKPYLHKLFIEKGWIACRFDGRIGLIVPAALYSDNGSRNLRLLLLEHGQWDWLFGFENRDKIFDIHRSFKFCAFVASKGGSTKTVRVSFMNRKLEDWDAGIGDTVTVSQVKAFSPKSGSFLEIRGKRDLGILEKIYSNPNVVMLGEQGPTSWQLTYRQGDYNMTSDSKLFPPIGKWEEKGYRGDEYGHWLKGDWQPYVGPDTNLAKPSDPSQRPVGTVLSQDRAFVLNLDTLEDIALPLYQGIMINHFDFAVKSYVSGAGNRAQWAEQESGRRIIRPQFLLGQKTYESKSGGAKLLFRDISNATNQRTFIGAVTPDWPAGNTTPVLEPSKGSIIDLGAVLTSLVSDYILRIRMTGTHLNYFVVEELPILAPAVVESLSRAAQALTVQHIAFAQYSDLPPSAWITDSIARVRARAELDARVALLYGLDERDLAYILSDCEHPADILSQKAFSRGLDPRGFWRVDKELPPEERHTVRTLKAFKAIKDGTYEQIAIESYDRAEAAERSDAEAEKERELVLAHRALIARIRSFDQIKAVIETPKAAAAKPEQADKKGQGLLF